MIRPPRAAPMLVVAVLITGCALGPRGDVASWYGRWHHGRPTASGEPFDMEALTAAHRSLPLGTCVEVIRPATGRRVYVRVNDRGPYVAGRTIDLSYRAAEELGMLDDGVAPVTVRRVQPNACPGSRTSRSPSRSTSSER